jgi:hypothetical protein
MNTHYPTDQDANLMTQSRDSGRDPFGLSALPELQPPADNWNAIAAQLQQEHCRRTRWISGLAVAASVTLAVGIVVLLPHSANEPLPTAETVAANTSGSREHGSLPQNGSLPQQDSPESVGGSHAADNLVALQKLSQRLEQNLAYLRSGVGAMPAEMVVYQVELEDLVAQVDAAISQRPDSGELWQQRVNLLLDLNQIYGEGLRREDPYVASL